MFGRKKNKFDWTDSKVFDEKLAATTTVQQPSISQRYDNFNFAVTANTNILPAAITVNNVPTGIIDIYASFTLAGNLSIIRTLGSTSVTEVLNNGTALVATAAYVFSGIPVATGETINLQYSTTTTCLKLNIIEEMK